MKKVKTAPAITAALPNGNQPAAEVKPAAITDLSYETVCKMPPEEQDRLMKSFQGRCDGITTQRDEVKQASKYAAILLAGVEVRVKRGIEALTYCSTFTASDLYKQVTGEKPPGHVWSLKNAYVNFVITGKIAESDFLGNRGNCLELAQKIVDAVIEKDPATCLQHEAVTRAATELKTRTEHEAKVLRSILASVKPAPAMTAEEALEAFKEICTSGNLPVCLAQMPDDVKTLSEQYQKEAYMALTRSLERVEKALGDKVEAWLTEAEGKITILSQPTPAPAQIAPTETPANPQPVAA